MMVRARSSSAARTRTSAEQQANWMLAIEGLVALFIVRPQVTAPIQALRIEQSSLVKAA